MKEPKFVIVMKYKANAKSITKKNPVNRKCFFNCTACGMETALVGVELIEYSAFRNVRKNKVTMINAGILVT